MEAIYDKIGEGYDTTRKVDPEILSTLSKLLDIEAGKNYLDIACGTGNYTNRISRFGGNWFACDGSEKMLSEARLKSSDIKWEKSEVSDLGYDSDFFDGAICSLAIHHFSDLTRPFCAISRVLKAGSNFVILTSTPAQMQSYWLNRYFPVMMEKSCEQMPSLEVVESALVKSSFCHFLLHPTSKIFSCIVVNKGQKCTYRTMYETEFHPFTIFAHNLN